MLRLGPAYGASVNCVRAAMVAALALLVVTPPATAEEQAPSELFESPLEVRVGDTIRIGVQTAGRMERKTGVEARSFSANWIATVESQSEDSDVWQFRFVGGESSVRQFSIINELTKGVSFRCTVSMQGRCVSIEDWPTLQRAFLERLYNMPEEVEAKAVRVVVENATSQSAPGFVLRGYVSAASMQGRRWRPLSEYEEDVASPFGTATRVLQKTRLEWDPPKVQDATFTVRSEVAADPDSLKTAFKPLLASLIAEFAGSAEARSEAERALGDVRLENSSLIVSTIERETGLALTTVAESLLMMALPTPYDGKSYTRHDRTEITQVLSRR